MPNRARLLLRFQTEPSHATSVPNRSHHALLGYGSELFRQVNLREKRELQANAHDASS